MAREIKRRISLNIEIDLYHDWMRIILDKIEGLKLDGFIFESFSEWEERRLKQLKIQKKSLEDQGINTTNVDKEINKTDLNDKYNDHLIR
jgi:hypothetical protein